jgi:IS30 family transposase
VAEGRWRAHTAGASGGVRAVPVVGGAAGDRGPAAGWAGRAIAVELGRSPSTISRELRRNQPAAAAGRQRRPPSYVPYAAHKRAELRGRRPKPSKLEHRPLAEFVHTKMDLKWSPQQISDELARTHAGQVEMQVSHETIYQALYVQGRGHLRADLHKQLWTGRAMRRPHGRAGAGKANLTDVVPIRERPAEADDRAVPGHWEGDLILGTNCRSAIGTLVERTTRFVLLVHLPDGHSAPAVRDAMIPTIATLPEQLRRSLAWDRGTELARHRDITLATGLDIYFCDPHSPWQRGSNGNTNGLLRQYFPKAPTFRLTTRKNSPASRPNSTADQERHWAGKLPPPRCRRYCWPTPLQRPPETAERPSGHRVAAATQVSGTSRGVLARRPQGRARLSRHQSACRITFRYAGPKSTTVRALSDQSSRAYGSTKVSNDHGRPSGMSSGSPTIPAPMFAPVFGGVVTLRRTKATVRPTTTRRWTRTGGPLHVRLLATEAAGP